MTYPLAELVIEKNEKERVVLDPADAMQSDTAASEESEEISFDELDLEWDIRLVPPPMPTQEIEIKLEFIGNEAPRILFDPGWE